MTLTQDLRFSEFNSARFEPRRRRVESDSFVDAALVSNDLLLPEGIYRLDAVLDWRIVAEATSSNGAHLSIHGVRKLISIDGGEGSNTGYSTYFFSDGKPFAISFGLGGWSKGKGFVELKELSISSARGQHEP